MPEGPNSATSPQSVFGQNVDLLADQTAKDRATSAFPALAKLLYWPEFNVLFETYEAPANRYQRAGRRAGLAAILFGTFALLASALSPLIGQGTRVFGLEAVTLIGIFAAATGFASVLYGSRALFGRAKLKWLKARMMTERLRQFYFQVFPRHLVELARALESESDARAFADSRTQWLAAFRLRFEGNEAAEFTAAISEDVSDDGGLHQPSDVPVSDDINPAVEQICTYYRQVRIQHQINYANHKLAPTSDGLSETEKANLFDQFSLISISIVFGMYALWLGLTFFVFTGSGESALQENINAIAHAVTLTLAIVILAARAAEEGLQPKQEVERYRSYRANLRAAATRFDTAKTTQEKISIMEQVERLAFDEMCTFLKAQNDARFRM